MPQPRAERTTLSWLRIAAWVAAASYALVGLVSMLAASPNVPYADSYRFLTTFLEHPFPENVLAADNGHREVLTNLVRLAELRWLHADQRLQTWFGLLGVSAAVALLVRAFKSLPADLRLSAITLTATSVFWLGNSRKLAHGSEAAHLGLVLLCLVLGLCSLVRLPRTDRGRGVWPAGLLGLAATLSFGSGVACFLAFGLVLWLQRAPWPQWRPLAIGAAAALLLLLLGGGGHSATVEIAPLAQFDLWVRWMGAPSVWALSPLLDVEHASRLPGAVLSAPAATIAATVQGWFGPYLEARWPAMAFGGVGLLALVLTTRRLRQRGGTTCERLGAGIAWFGAGVGLLVVALRATYFHDNPDQLTSQRYLPWSTLLWLGLALTFVARPHRAPRRALLAALAVALVLAPSQVWTGRNALRLQQTASLTAVGAAVGVLGFGFPLVETNPEDLKRALPHLREFGAAMFAWPETAVLGTAPAPDRLRSVAGTIETRVVTNRLPGAGSQVTATCDETAAARLIVLDATGAARGILVPVATSDSANWSGWLRGEAAAAELRLAALR